MPESILNRFGTLESSEVAGSQLRLRFVPIDFNVQHTDPVLRIEVDLTVEIEQAEQKISQIQGEIVEEIEADETTLSIWIEGMVSPIGFQGSITWKYEDYETSDYIDAIKDRDLIRDQQYGQIVHLRQTIDRALRFIDRTIARTAKKEEHFRPDNARYTQQIQLLRGVRRQLEDD